MLPLTLATTSYKPFFFSLTTAEKTIHPFYLTNLFACLVEHAKTSISNSSKAARLDSTTTDKALLFLVEPRRTTEYLVSKVIMRVTFGILTLAL